MVALLLIGPAGLDRSHVVVRRGRRALPHARRVHRGERQAAAELRCLAHAQILALRHRDQTLPPQERADLVELRRDVGHQGRGLRPVRLERIERRRHALAGCQALGDLLHAGARRAELAPPAREQRVDRRRLHLVVRELALIGLAAERIRPRRARQQVVAQEADERLDRAHRERVGFREIRLQPGVAAARRGGSELRAIQAQDSFELADRDLGRDARRPAQVDARRAQHFGHLPEPPRHGQDPAAGRREIALDQRLDSAGDEVEIRVGIRLERADRLEIEQLALDARGEQVVLERAIERQRTTRDRGEPRAEVAEPGRVLFERRLRDGQEQLVVVVNAGAGRDVRPRAHHVVEELLAELRERRIAARRRARAARDRNVVGRERPRRREHAERGEARHEECAARRGRGAATHHGRGTTCFTSTIGSGTLSGEVDRYACPYFTPICQPQ